VQPLAGATGSRTATTGGSSHNGIGQLVALAPAREPTVSVSWTPAPSAFATGHVVERWQSGTLQDSQTVTPASTGLLTDGPLVPAVTYEYRIRAFYEQWTSTTVTRSVTASCPASASPSAVALVSRVSETDAIEITWDDSGFLNKGLTASAGDWRNMVATASPTRDEIIALGVYDSGLITGEGRITGQIRSSGTWAAMPGGTLGVPTTSTHRGFDVAYEFGSGDAVAVWNNGTVGSAGLSYTVWDGSAWLPVDTIATPLPGEPQHLRLAADPTSDEMILVASNSSGQDYALVWDGDQWVAGDTIVLDATGGDEPTTVNVAYEHQTGEAMAVYGRGAGSISYRIWTGAWGNQVSLLPASGVTGVPQWTTIATHAGSDRFALGVTTTTGSLWLVHWTGSFWQSQIDAGTAWTTNAPVLGLGFEPLSGRALAVYGLSGTNAQSYRTWSPGSGWSAQATGPNLGSAASSTIVRPRPGSDEIMVLVQDSSSDLVVMRWDGTAFVTSQSLAKTNETFNQPFEWVWQ
jgi:hypothetical protein